MRKDYYDEKIITDWQVKNKENLFVLKKDGGGAF
jgi:hypothetical protein